MKAPPLAGTALAGPPSPTTRPAEADLRKRVEALAEEDRLLRQENGSLRRLVAEAGVSRRPAAAPPAPASRPARADLSAVFDVDEGTARQWQKKEAMIRGRAEGRRTARTRARTARPQVPSPQSRTAGWTAAVARWRFTWTVWHWTFPV